jgi:hypothetical protein
MKQRRNKNLIGVQGMEIRRKAKHNDGEVGGRKSETNMDTDTVNQEEGR